MPILTNPYITHLCITNLYTIHQIIEVMYKVSIINQ